MTTVTDADGSLLGTAAMESDGAQEAGHRLAASRTRPCRAGLPEGGRAEQGAAIRAVLERNVELLARRPDRGHLTCTTRARLLDGLRCEIEEGPWRFNADLPAKAGGGGTAPTPGVLGRGALASCLAIGIAAWGARQGIPLDAVEVEVQADFDARGELGMGEGIPPGYAEVRYSVSVASQVPRHALDELLDLVERHSPYLDVFGRAIPLKRVPHLDSREV
jgi:uncharacterized OsmC-like protein